MPIALRNHSAPLRSASGIEVAIAIPRSVLWNRVASAVAQRCGIAREDPAAGAIESHYCYSDPTGDPDVARQTRTQLRVRLPLGRADASAVDIQVSTEVRERRAGQQVSEWRRAEPDPTPVSGVWRDVHSSLSPRRTMSLPDVVFEGDAPNALQRLAVRLSPYVEAERSLEAVSTQWRVTQEDMQPGTLWLRSRVQFIVETQSGGTRVSVVAQLQRRVEEPTSAPDASSSQEGPLWIDLDAAPIVAHATAIAAEALRARSLNMEEEPINALASAAPPEPPVQDPSSTWTDTSLPAGVGTTTETESAELFFPEGSSPERLLGTVYDSSMRPMQGSIAPIGELERSQQRGTRSRLRILEFESDIEVGARYFGLGGSVGRTSQQRTAVFTSLVEEERISMPRYARFDGINAQASYYVAAVVIGRTIDVAITSSENTIRAAIGLQYGGLEAQTRGSLRQRNIRCRVNARGFHYTLGCRDSLPDVTTLQEAVVGASGAVPVLIVVRRIPDRMRADGPRQYDIEIRSVGASRPGQGWFEGEVDLRYRIVRSDGGAGQLDTRRDDCPRDRNPCTLNPPYTMRGVSPNTPEMISLTLEDVDVLFNDHLGTMTVPLRELIPDVPRERRPVADCEWQEISRGNVRLAACVFER